jgi:hypothetical protein
MLRAQLTATLPADTHVQTVQLPASEAARLLNP